MYIALSCNRLPEEWRQACVTRSLSRSFRRHARCGTAGGDGGNNGPGRGYCPDSPYMRLSLRVGTSVIARKASPKFLDNSFPVVFYVKSVAKVRKIHAPCASRRGKSFFSFRQAACFSLYSYGQGAEGSLLFSGSLPCCSGYPSTLIFACLGSNQTSTGFHLHFIPVPPPVPTKGRPEINRR